MQQKGLVNTTVLLLVWAVVSVVILGSIYYVYFRTRKVPALTPATPKPIALASVNPLDRDTIAQKKGLDVVTLQDDYSLDLSLPLGLTLTEGEGDYSSFIINKDSFKLIGFLKTSKGRPSSNVRGTAQIDGVPFNLYYKNKIQCGVRLEPQKVKFSDREPIADQLHLEIATWCGDYKDNDPLFNSIISRISFSPKLKKFLNGEESGPILKLYPADF